MQYADKDKMTPQQREVCDDFYATAAIEAKFCVARIFQAYRAEVRLNGQGVTHGCNLHVINIASYYLTRLNALSLRFSNAVFKEWTGYHDVGELDFEARKIAEKERSTPQNV